MVFHFQDPGFEEILDRVKARETSLSPKISLKIVYVEVNIQDIKGKPSLTLSRSVSRQRQISAEVD